MDQSQNQPAREGHDGEKIKRLREEKSWTQEKAADHLRISTSTVKRIENNKTRLDIVEITAWANFLDVDIRDLLKDAHKDLVPTIQLKTFASETRLDSFLLGLENQGRGRIGIFNTFPSLVYQPSECAARTKRREQLTHNKDNIDYYPLTAVLNFGFSVCSAFSKDQKIHILDQIIAAFSAKDGTLRNQLNLVNTASYGYPWEAPDCEIIQDTDYLLMTAPIHKHSVIVIRSTELVKTIGEKIIRRNEHVLYTARSVRLLEILKQCLEQDLPIDEFVELLRQNKSKLAEMVVNNLRPSLRERIMNSWG